MTLLAITAEDRTFWYVALAVGAVVLAVVVALLTLLVLFLRDIDGGMRGALGVAQGILANTAAAEQFEPVRSAVREIRDELSVHAQILSERRR